MFFAQKKRATLAASLSALKFPRSALRSLLSVALSSAAFKSTLYDTSFSSYCQYFTCGYLPFWCGYFSVSLRLFLRARAALTPVFTLQVFDVQNVEVTEETKVSTTSTLFGGLTKEVMIELGAPQDLIPFLKSIPDKDAFNADKDKLPSDVYENFSWVAEGFDPKEIIDMIKADTSDTELEQEETEKGEPLPVSEDFSVALKNSESKKSFVVIEGEEELRRIMAEPLEKWRVFLHPTQRKIVKKNYKGSARVLGGAGTGKTVVAMHRAKYLASQISDDKRILFTTFTANLAEDIKGNLRKICSLEELHKIEVINIDAWVMRFLNEVGFSAKIEYGEEIDKLWDQAVANSLSELDFPWSFYKDEWNRVVIPQEALSLEKYIKAKRTGRGVRLDRKKRIEVWKVFDAYLSLM